MSERTPSTDQAGAEDAKARALSFASGEHYSPRKRAMQRFFRNKLAE